MKSIHLNLYPKVYLVTEEEIKFKEKIKAIQDTMYVIGGKWKIAIILSIYSGNKRFNDIAASIPKITNRVLSVITDNVTNNNTLIINI